VPVPPVVTQIQALRYRFRRGVPMFNQKAALRLAFRAADRILANSELVAESLAAYAGGSLDGAALKKKTHVVSPNLRREFLQVARANAPGPTPEPGRILFFGALNEKKGADLFLKAICESEAALSGGVFVVAGDFTENDPRFRRRWAEALAAAEIQLPPTQLQLPGKLSLEETLREIQRASLVVFPSLFDEYSRALVEALILCRPVITTKGVGAWPLVAEHVCGLVIEPNDAAALTEAIDTMMHPQAHYAANALHLAHRLLHEVSPEAIALQIEHHLQETARPSS
jgi:glycosyltransferase involved in cell wall biosynthesis